MVALNVLVGEQVREEVVSDGRGRRGRARVHDAIAAAIINNLVQAYTVVAARMRHTQAVVLAWLRGAVVDLELTVDASVADTAHAHGSAGNAVGLALATVAARHHATAGDLELSTLN